VLYPFEGRSAIERSIIEVVFPGDLKNGVMDRNKRGACRGEARLSLRVRGGFGVFKKSLLSG